MDYQLLGIFTTLTLSFFFAGAETVLLSFTKTLLPGWLLKNRRGAQALEYLTAFPEKFLVATLTGNNLVNVAYSSLAALWLTRQGFSEQFVLIAAPLFLLIFGESVPKSLSYQLSDRIACPTAASLQVFRKILKPLLWLVESISNRLKQRWGFAAAHPGLLFQRADITFMLKQITHGEALSAPSRRLLGRLVEAGTKRVEDIMTPRRQVVLIPVETNLSEARQIMQQSGFSRLPCYSGSVDNVLGVVNAKDLLTAGSDLRSLLQPLRMAPETLPVLSLLTWFRQQEAVFAGVVDEYGGLAGVVSIEDVAELLFGPIWDEYDQEVLGLLRLSETVWIAEGKIKLHTLMETVPLSIPVVKAPSLGGLINKTISRIPQIGEEFTLGNAEIRILRANQREVQLVRITIIRKS